MAGPYGGRENSWYTKRLEDWMETRQKRSLEVVRMCCLPRNQWEAMKSLKSLGLFCTALGGRVRRVMGQPIWRGFQFSRENKIIA